MFSFLLFSAIVHVAVGLKVGAECRYSASGSHTLIDFSSVTPGQDVGSFLSNHGFSISDYDSASTPLAHQFTPSNVAFGSGTLDMKVSAYSSGKVQSAEIVSDNTAMYGSVRVVYKSSSTKGVVEGSFFYLNDTQEVDFEMLTTTTLTASESVAAGIWATNQAVAAGEDKTYATVPLSFDPSSDFHEYRMDWSEISTTFYIDGVQKAQHVTNIPTAPLHYIFNVWSTGDKLWSAGPPTQDSITSIRFIDLYQGYIPSAVTRRS
ncbi:concanavalin A-like lectin/glucanase [Mycena floridula]|nr:concanavalin A-like lectin/glucanase [Mycena floridula]